MSEFETIANLASDLTTIGVLLLWLRAERSDSSKLWSVIHELVRIRLKQVEVTDHVEATVE